MAKRRAHADEYASRVNRAVALLGERPPAAVVWALATEFGLSERQARRYVQAARRCPDGVVVPERTVRFTVRLPASVVAGVRGVAARGGESLSATAARALHDGLERAERPGRSARGGAPRSG
jgi:predicted DNA-binding transcriptional regulator YafY